MCLVDDRCAHHLFALSYASIPKLFFSMAACGGATRFTVQRYAPLLQWGEVHPICIYPLRCAYPPHLGAKSPRLDRLLEQGEVLLCLYMYNSEEEYRSR